MPFPKKGEFYCFKSGTFIRIVNIRAAICFLPAAVVFRYIYIASPDSHLPMLIHRNSVASVSLEQWEDMINDKELTLVMAYRKTSVSDSE